MSKSTLTFLNKTRVGTDFRTTIPEEVRNILRVNKGDEILWIKEDGKILVDKVVKE